MGELSLYERVLEGLAEGASLPRPAVPRASASVLLWRRLGDGSLSVFWVQRAESLAFMGGWHAFPGGALSRRDPGLPVGGLPRGIDEGPEEAAMPDLVRCGLELGPMLPPGLLACAARELFEEVGLLLGPGLDRESVAGGVEEALSEGRRRLLDKQVRFGDWLRAAGLTLDVSGLVYAGRWLTPPLGPMRFDNRFFLLEWPQTAALQPSILPGELQSGEWIEPAAAIERWRRGEVLAAPPILHLLEVLAAEGPEAGLGRLRNPVEANLGGFRRIEFRPGVLLFPLATPTLPPAGHTNAYVLGNGEAVLVDPGSPFAAENDALIEAVAALAAEGRRVSRIWLTHHHPDHVGGVTRLAAELDLPVEAHARTAERLAALDLEVDGSLADGDSLVLEGDPTLTVRVLHTPGHARGHLCFYEETGGSLLAGDMVAGFGTIVIDPPEGDMGDYLRSLGRLRELAPRTLFPAHGPTIRNAVAKIEEYIEHRLWRGEEVRRAWAGGLREPAQIRAAVYDEVPEVARPLAERQVVAHLEHLAAAGRLA